MQTNQETSSIKTTDLEKNNIDWSDLQKKSGRKYFSFIIDKQGDFNIIISSAKPFASKSAFKTLNEFKNIVCNYFPEAHTSHLGRNFINLAKLIKDNYMSRSSLLRESENRQVESVFNQIVNRMVPSPSLDLCEDVFRKIFGYLSIKDLHNYECVNRFAFEQAKSVWKDIAGSFKWKMNNPDRIRKKIAAMGTSLNVLLRADFFPREAIHIKISGQVDREATLQNLYDYSEGLNDYLYYSLKWENDYWRHLLVLGANPKWITKNGDSILLMAVASRNYELFNKILLLKNVDINLQNSIGVAPVHSMAFNGYVEGMKQLADHGAILTLATHQGLTPLHLACKSGHFEMVKYLIEKKADLEARDKEGMTPVFYAFLSPVIVQLLLKAGANANAAIADGTTPEFYILRHIKQFHWMTETTRRRDNSFLFRTVLELMEANGFDPRKKDPKGKTLLHWVVLAADIKVRRVYSTNDCFYYVECFKNSEEIMEIVAKLIRLGADVLAVDDSGNTPLKLSYSSDYYQNIKGMPSKSILALRKLLTDE